MALTDYEKYIRTEELLALQKEPADLTTHDEMQFQIVHQVAELWMKLIDFELKRVVVLLDEDRLAMATLQLVRVGRAQKLPVNQMDLLDTMSPKDYMPIRTGPGSGGGQAPPGGSGGATRSRVSAGPSSPSAAQSRCPSSEVRAPPTFDNRDRRASARAGAGVCRTPPTAAQLLPSPRPRASASASAASAPP